MRRWGFVLFLLGCLTLCFTGFQTKARPAKAGPAPGRPAASSVQIVAHPDDDLFFMNPDLAEMIRSGVPVTTVYVTAAESNGKNVRKGEGRGARADKAGYVAARHAGVRRAYSQMATGRPDAKWVTTTTPTPAGPVETNRLARHPQIQLIFLDVAQMSWKGNPTRLAGLVVHRNVRAVQTLLGRGSPVTKNHSYTREELIGTLTSLLLRVRPSVVRMQDPAPERGEERRDFGHRSDHPDHTATALLTREVLSRYERAGAPVVVEAYRGYYNRHWPHNLSGPAAAEKLALIGLYGWADKSRFRCRTRWGCGDLRVAGSGARNGWAQSTNHRYPGTTRWLARRSDGRLAAYAVVGGRVMRWQERTPGGAWSPGVAMSEPGFTPDLSVVRLADGRFAILGLRVLPGSWEPRVALSMRDRWVDLGVPDRGGDVGIPAAVVDGAGRITVFARNTWLGVSARVQRHDGTFGPWRGIGGHRIQEGLAAATDRTGRIELFGATEPARWRWKATPACRGLWRWRQRAPGGPMGRETWLHTTTAVTGPLTIGPDHTLLARRPGSGDTAAFAAIGRQLSLLSGPGGFGPVAPAAGAFAGRDGQGKVGIFEEGHWESSGALFVHSPAIERDARGRLVVAVLGIDGRLHIARRASGSSWRWQLIP